MPYQNEYNWYDQDGDDDEYIGNQPDDLDVDEDEPYRDVTTRPPLVQVSGVAVQQPQLSQSEQVKQAIAKKQGMTLPSSAPVAEAAQVPPQAAPNNYQDDPLYKDYQASQGKLDDFRRAKLGADLGSNLAQAFSQIAQGPHEPQQNQALFQNMNTQSNHLLNSLERDQDRRQRVLNAIIKRKGGGGVPNPDDLKVDKFLSQLGSRFEQDPVLKPSQVNLASLNKSEGILLNHKAPLTIQSLSDAQTDLASALSLRPGALSEGKIKRSELLNLDTDIAELKQRWGKKIVDVRKEAPRVVEQVIKLNRILKNDYVDAINARTAELVNKHKSLFNNDRFRAGLDRYLNENKLKRSPDYAAKTVKVKIPNGDIKDVPLEKLQEVLDAGAKRVQ